MQHAKDKGITAFKIEGEGEVVTFKPFKEGDDPTSRLVLPVSYNGFKTGDPSKWKVTNSSKDILIKFFGKKTEEWVSKEVDIQIVDFKDKGYISVDQLRMNTRYSKN